MDDDQLIKCPKCGYDKAKSQPNHSVYCKVCGYVGPIGEAKKSTNKIYTKNL